MTTTAPTKYQAVRNKLEGAIRSGEFAIGDQLPAEQALADQYGVSLMTARRVVCDLVSADLLERRGRTGTFVRQHAVDKITTTTLNLVVVDYDTSFQRTFLSQGMRAIGQREWRGNVIRLAKGQQDAAVRAIQDGELALLMLEELQPQSALGLAVRRAKGRVVSIGLDATRLGIPSINVDVSRSFSMVMEYLRGLGHENIVLIDQKIAENLNELHAAAWRKATAEHYSPAEAEAHSIHLETPNFHCPSFDAFDAVRKLLTDNPNPPTALVCFGEEITQGVLAACRTTGHVVPDTISVVNILDAPSMVFSHPSVTSMDVDFTRQIELALEILDAAAAAGTPPEAALHRVEPLLLERESAAQVPEKN